MSSTGRTPIRVANFSGYLGDRRSAIDEVMAGDPVDVLMGDYLAELTMAALANDYRENPEHAYVAYFVQQLRPHLAAVAERGMKVVTNAGGLSPASLAEKLRALVREEGLDLTVAHVAGDSILDRIDDLQAAGHRLEHLDTGAPVKDWGAEPRAANAYLGAFGIATALRNGADIVVTGRVTDASLTVGPAAWWHGWSPDDWSPLAGAVVAGHVIECGAQATGGNFSGFQKVPGVRHPGFPIAEIAADGSSVITKHRRDGGTVTVDTVTAQLVYEIQGPIYLNPDVTVHLDTVELTQLGPDRVGIGPVAGTPPPRTTKIALFAQTGWQTSQTVFCTGPDVGAKVALLRSQLHDALGEVDVLDVSPVGAAVENPSTQWEATVPIRVMAIAERREALRSFAGVLFGLYLQSFPGLHLDGGAQRLGPPWPRMGYWPGLVDVEVLDHVAVLEDGSVVEAPRPSRYAEPDEIAQPEHPEPPRADADGAQLPLGTLAHARSGDKGSDSNLGVWVTDRADWPWLRSTLSTEALRALLPETRDLRIIRHELPRLNAVHFVVKGLLGTETSPNVRIDHQGKSLGEYLRAKHVAIPARGLA
ncbi:acyclic terpene utilization AtuA family protein [Parafrankia sp. EUN1f]|uniref:acyclic terpene utilization AtuA family protein n=1 Tax=Parafrankia sp. EUN1f TaxID=102897 RepID=UPI0001C4422A|nr:acyclic terpene utilization AtuA family protein [Parafrankia sp. EUN1f]EFC85786.1 protein of unknown function DUF1446 [Parafrankia sp. EUN1f]